MHCQTMLMYPGSFFKGTAPGKLVGFFFALELTSFYVDPLDVLKLRGVVTV